jgi:hypothetical protein
MEVVMHDIRRIAWRTPIIRRSLAVAAVWLATILASGSAEAQFKLFQPPKACMVDIGLKGGIAVDNGKPANPRYCSVSSSASLGSDCTCAEWGRGKVVINPSVAK